MTRRRGDTSADAWMDEFAEKCGDRMPGVATRRRMPGWMDEFAEKCGDMCSSCAHPRLGRWVGPTCWHANQIWCPFGVCSWGADGAHLVSLGC
jgi:hypothetical protein